MHSSAPEPVVVHADLRWAPNTGIGVVKKELVDRVPGHFRVQDLRVRGRIGSPLSPLAITVALSRATTRRGLFWSPGFVPPLTYHLPSIVTVHDLMHLRFYTRFHKAYYDLVLKRLYRRCTAIFCVSEFTRSEFLEWSGVSADRVFTVYNGVSGIFSRNGSASPFPFSYALYPGNRRSNKNIPRLMQAYAASELPKHGIHLVLTGTADEHLQQQAVTLGFSDMLHFAGDVDEQGIASLFRGARLVCYVSLYEGFGLPILEAMASGVPVLTSSTSSMPEVAGDAALCVNPYSVEEISAGLNHLAFNENERDRYIRLGHVRATKFNWDTSAAKLWSVISNL